MASEKEDMPRLPSVSDLIQSWRDCPVRWRDGVGHMIYTGSILLSMAVIGCGGAPTQIPIPHETSKPVSFITQDSLEIRGHLFGEGEAGVVLAHMFPADQTSWWEFAQTLADEGYMAMAFDFRGYRDSGSDKEIELIDQDVVAALEFLTAQGASAVFLAGVSMGGTASLKVAAQRGNDVAGVVALSAPIEFEGISVKGQRVQVPVLLMAAEGDRSAARNVNKMFDDVIVTDLAERVVFEGVHDHGTDLLKGNSGTAAKSRIIRFLVTHRQ